MANGEDRISNLVLDKNYVPTRLNINLIPCNIHHSGAAPVSDYFVEQEGFATFRGRGMYSHSLQLPENYNLTIIADDSAKPLVAKQASFKVFSVDERPDKGNCCAMNIPDWIDLASRIHS